MVQLGRHSHHVRIRRHACLLAGWLCAGELVVGAELPRPGSSRPSAALPPVARAVWLQPDATLGERFVIDSGPTSPAAGTTNNPPVFFAFPPTQWWRGLVPLFEVERGGSLELRCRPAKGMENATEPFCYVLPLPDELNAINLVGRWECTATRSNGSESWFVWELASDGNRLSGRFDQGTEYRVAFLTGGEVHSNRVTLTVEYIEARYELTGEWQTNRMFGSWRQLGEEERGRWRATAIPSMEPGLTNTEGVPLFEFRRGRARRYLPAPRSPGPDWERAARPLGRVWLSRDER